jgi:hypothetical protein
MVKTFLKLLTQFRDRFARQNFSTRTQGCQMVHFHTKNLNLGRFWSVLQRKMSVNFNAIWSILWPFDIFCGHFGIFFPVLVCCTKKNLATLLRLSAVSACLSENRPFCVSRLRARSATDGKHKVGPQRPMTADLQGDQTSFRKIAQNIARPVFPIKINTHHLCTIEKSSTTFEFLTYFCTANATITQ